MTNMQASTMIAVPNYMAILALEPVPTPAVTIVNGYQIQKADDCALWACTKIGEICGKGFKTKRAAIGYAVAN